MILHRRGETLTRPYHGTVEMLKKQNLQQALGHFAQSISLVTGFEVAASLYEGVGLNNKKSLFCDYEVKNIPFRMYLEVTTNSRYDLDVFIIDINLPGVIRGRGIGSSIVCRLLGILTSLGVGRVTLNTANARAENFWEKFHFKKVPGKKLMFLNLKDRDHLSRCMTLMVKSMKQLTA